MWRLRPALPTLTFWCSALPIDADGRAALGAHEPHLAGGQAQRRHVAVLGHQLDRGAGRARRSGRRGRAASSTLCTTVPTGMRASGRQLPTAMSASSPEATLMPTVSRCGREDVALLAVGVVQQRDVGGAVGVVLDRGDLRRHAVLAALEVDPPVEALGAAAAVARGLAPVRVAPAALLEPFDERALGLGLGDLGEVRIGDEARPGLVGLGLRIGISLRGPRGPGRSGWSRRRGPARSPSSTCACARWWCRGAWAWT